MTRVAAAWLLALAALAVRTPAETPGRPTWRALFVETSPTRVAFWTTGLDGRDRRPLPALATFGTRSGDWTGRYDAHVPAVTSAVSADGRWIACTLDASPARESSLWLMSVADGRRRLVAANVETFQWASAGAQLLYSLAPPPPDALEELRAVQEGRHFRVHDADTGLDAAVAGTEWEFYAAGPWSHARKLLFWRVGPGLDQLRAFDAERGAVRDGRSFVRTNVRQFDARPGHAWALVTTEILGPQCLEARDVDADGRVGAPFLTGCGYVCTFGSTCIAWRDAHRLVVAKSDARPRRTNSLDGWPHEHSVSLVEHDARDGRERVLVDGRPDTHWRVLGSQPGEVLLVGRSAVDRPLSAGYDFDVEIQARGFDGRVLGILHRGGDPPWFVGFVR